MKICKKCLAVLFATCSLFHLPSLAYCASLSVREAVDMAMEQSLLIKIKEKDEATAKAILKAARGENSISLSATAGMAYSHNSNGGDNVQASKPTSKASAGLTFSLPIYNFGKNSANIDSGELEVQSSYLTTFREMENVKLSVIKAYYDVLEAEKTVGVRQESVSNYEAHLNNVQQLFIAGKKAKVDVLRSLVELSNAKQELLKAENTRDINVSTLKNVLYMNQNEPLNLTEDFSYREFQPALGNCIDYAIENRKDLRVQNNILRQRELSVKIAKTGYWPSINLAASTTGAQVFHPNTNDSHGYSAGVNVSWNIFDSGITQAAVDKAKAAKDIAELTLEKDKNDIDLSVRKAYLNMREAEKRFSSTKAAVGQAEEDYFISREKYRVGEGLLLDVIDAQLALSTAKLNYINAQYDYARYKATVENEIGLGVNESIDTLPIAASTNSDKYYVNNSENLFSSELIQDSKGSLDEEVLERISATESADEIGEVVNE